jgi:type II secretory pathway pseudopilin PulG
MDGGLVVVLAVLCAVMGVALATLVVLMLRARRQLSDDLAASRAQVSTMQHRLDALARRVDPPPTDGEPGFVITTAGEHEPRPAQREVARRRPVEPLSGRTFASAAVGESLVTVFSFGYGVRRALSAENRNRIGFEIRRETRRARKQRRHKLKEARRTHRVHRTTGRADLDEDAA